MNTSSSRRCGNMWLLICLLVGQLTSPLGAVELVGNPKAEVRKDGVVISWNTDTACGSRVGYGNSPARLNKEMEGDLGVVHQVTLSDLKPGVTYYYSLGTSKRWLTSGTITTDGSSMAKLGTGSDPDSKPQTETKSSPPAKGETSRPLPKLTDAPPKKITPNPATSSAGPVAPPTKKTWGYLPSLQDHFDRHGRDFSASSPDDYAAKAWMFLQYAKQNGLPMKWDDSDDTLRIWEPKSRAFAAFNRDGTTKTFFRPGNSSYWSRQPGRPVKASELPF